MDLALSYSQNGILNSVSGILMSWTRRFRKAYLQTSVKKLHKSSTVLGVSSSCEVILNLEFISLQLFRDFAGDASGQPGLPQ